MDKKLNQNVISPEDVDSFAFKNRLKMIVNGERFSDVKFEVGLDKRIINGHTLILSLASPVFERMFYGNLIELNKNRNTDEPIQVPDITATGFLNMLKYIYDYQIADFLNLSEIAETYKAADKYMVFNLKEQILDFIEQKLNHDNYRLIYKQLILTQYEDILSIKKMRQIIQSNTKQIFENELSTKICESTLIDLLNIDYLMIEEIDVLKFCVKWVEEEILRLNLEPTLTNKQQIFEPFKILIRFKDLSLSDINDFFDINSLLNTDDATNLASFLTDKSRDFDIKCETQRKKPKSYQINSYVIDTDFKRYSQFKTLLNVNRRCLVKRIYTTLHKNVTNLNFKIYHHLDKKKQYECDFDYVIIDDHHCIDFKNHFEFVSRINYELKFNFRKYYPHSWDAKYNLRSVLQKPTENGEIKFNLNSVEKKFCISKIDLFILVD